MVRFTDEDGAHDHLSKSLFMQEANKRGVLFTGGHILTYSHTDEDVESLLNVYDECLGVLADALEAGDVESRLEGEPVGATLRERTGEND